MSTLKNTSSSLQSIHNHMKGAHSLNLCDADLDELIEVVKLAEGLDKSCPVPTPLKVVGTGSDSWLSDANQRAVISATNGLTESEHESFLEWVAQVAEGQGWRPIETAPIGGGAERTDDPKWVDPPRIIIGFNDGGACIAKWDHYYDVGGRGYRGTDTAWVCDDGELAEFDLGVPTHWMPLPEPPTK